MEIWQVVLTAAVVSIFLSRFLPADNHRSERRRLERLESKMDVLLRHLNLEAEFQAQQQTRLEALMTTGPKLEAIMALRESAPDLSLQDAKEYVEAKMAQGRNQSAASPPRPR